MICYSINNKHFASPLVCRNGVHEWFFCVYEYFKLEGINK